MPDIVDPRVDPRLVPEGSQARVLNGPKNEWRDLPSIRTPNGYVITRWQFTDDEKAAILRGEDLFVTLVSFGAINPLNVTVGPCDWNINP